jgi:hypothetical protein
VAWWLNREKLVTGSVVIRERSDCALVVNQSVGSYWLCGDQREVRLCFGGESECGQLLVLW